MCGIFWKRGSPFFIEEDLYSIVIGISRSPLLGSLEMTTGGETFYVVSFRTPGWGEKSLRQSQVYLIENEVI